MKGYIKPPQWVDLKLICKKSRVGDFIQQYKWTDNQCLDMECLSKEYNRNSKTYDELIKELTLRGVEFVYDSGIVYNNIYGESEAYLYKMLDSQAYKNIDFKYLGIEDIIGQFHIESDRFFNYIPLKGFKTLKPQVDLLLLEQLFVERGFVLIKTQEKRDLGDEINKVIFKEFKKEVPKKQEQIESRPVITQKLESVNLYKGNKDGSNYISKGNIQQQYFLEKLLTEPQHVEFIEFCKENHITNLDEINYSLLDAYWNLNKQTKLKFEQIKEHLEKLKK